MNGSLVEATPFYYGAGYVWPNCAADPGLVYDSMPKDYLNFLCGHGYKATQLASLTVEPYKCPRSYNILNLYHHPKIIVPNLAGSVPITWTLKNVKGHPSI